MSLTNYISNLDALIAKVEIKKAALGQLFLAFRNKGKSFDRMFEEVNLISDLLEKIEDDSISTAEKEDFLKFLQKYAEIDQSPFPLPSKYR